MKTWIAWGILASVVWAQPPIRTFLKTFQRGGMQTADLPKADANGDFSRGEINYHSYWMVVANDGLNGRWSAEENELKLPTWPVVRVFAAGSILTAVPDFETQTGFLIGRDGSDKMWLRVLDGQTDRPSGYCFVRANKNFIVPVRISTK